ILEEGDKPDDSFPVKAAKETYRTCMDAGNLEAKGLKPLSDLLISLGDWPMATDVWNEETFNWQEVVPKVIKHLNISPLLSLYVYLDRKNSNQSVITVDQSSLVLPRSMLVDPFTYGNHLEAYRRWIMDSAFEVINARNITFPKTRISIDAYDLIEFEIQLAQITTPNEKRRNAYRTYNPMTLKELYNLTDSINWHLILETLFADINIMLTPEERIVVKEIEYLSELISLLDNTSPRVIANYIHWRIVKSFSRDLTWKMRELAFQFEKVYSGTKEDIPRWRECVYFTTGSLSFAVGYSYLWKVELRNVCKALTMVENIRNQFISSINDLEWMDVATQKVAQEKAEAMRELIGYPDWFSNMTALEEYYKGVKVGKNHLENVASLKTLKIRRMLSKLRLPTYRSEWNTSPDVVNAYYNPQTNSIIFPAGILQQPFFSKRRPEALNYGSVGVVIGHEITHGFDDMGRMSDKYGNLAQWWSEETIDTYLKKAHCFIEQYGMYRIPELDELLHIKVTMNGVTTQGENMADNGGLRQAFYAYRKFVEQNGPDKRLPGLEQFSPEQLFFLGFATVWCESATKESLLHEVLTDPHSPQRLRVKGTLANSREFAQVWNCPTGSAMNPEHKCQIW
ncbi:hypothetical protein L9F63_018419, partial [Diploptera punctata]